MTPPSLADLPSADNGRDWLAFGVALYGAIVASGVAAYQFLRDRPGVRLVFTPTMSLMKSDESEDGFEEMMLWHVSVVNHRKRPITLRSGGLLIRGRSRLHPIFHDLNGKDVPSPFPVTLQDGEAIEFYVRKNDNVETTGAWASDVLERYFTVRYPARNPRKRFTEWRWARMAKKHQRKLARERGN